MSNIKYKIFRKCQIKNEKYWNKKYLENIKFKIFRQRQIYNIQYVHNVKNRGYNRTIWLWNNSKLSR